MRELTIVLLAIVIAIVVASKESDGNKNPSSRSSSEEEKAAEGSGEEALKKIELGDQNLESSGAVDKTSMVEDRPEPEGSGEAGRL